MAAWLLHLFCWAARRPLPPHRRLRQTRASPSGPGHVSRCTTSYNSGDGGGGRAAVLETGAKPGPKTRSQAWPSPDNQSVSPIWEPTMARGSCLAMHWTPSSNELHCAPPPGPATGPPPGPETGTAPGAGTGVESGVPVRSRGRPRNMTSERPKPLLRVQRGKHAIGHAKDVPLVKEKRGHYTT